MKFDDTAIEFEIMPGVFSIYELWELEKMNFVDAIKQVLAAGKDLETVADLWQNDPDKQKYIDALTDAIQHLEKAAADIGIPL